MESAHEQRPHLRGNARTPAVDLAHGQRQAGDVEVLLDLARVSFGLDRGALDERALGMFRRALCGELGEVAERAQGRELALRLDLREQPGERVVELVARA